MIRSGRHKLIYCHGMAPQLFDLGADPHERHDLAGDPAHASLRERLTAQVLDGWHPDDIPRRVRERRADKNILDAWARCMRPRDEFRWNLLPEDNRLDPLTE